MALHQLLILLGSDLYRDGRPLTLARLIVIYLFRRDNRRIYVLIRLARFFDQRGHRRLCARALLNMRREFNCIVSPKAEIGARLKLPHPLGIVIGEGVRIGDGCTIYQQVTLGGARKGDWQAGRYPNVGDNVVLFAGAKIVGAIDIGDRSVIGANAVVIKAVGADAVAVGIPAVSRPREHASVKASAPAGRALPE